MPLNREILIFENPFLLTNYLLREWQHWADEAIKERNQFNVAFSGGKTPLEFYCRLSSLKDAFLWPKTHIFMVDERFVPFEHKESNFGALRENLLNDIPLLNSQLHPIKTSFTDVMESAKDYEEHLMNFFNLGPGAFPVFDAVFLGVGEDGHVASLFPGSLASFELRRLAVPISLPSLSSFRISLSFSVLNNARRIIVLVTGNNKASIVKEVLEENKDIPATHLYPQQGTLSFYLDKEAAQKLTLHRDSFIHKEEAIVIEG